MVWSTERELLAFVKLWRTACLSRKMSMTKTSERWAMQDQMTSDLIINMCSELEWHFTAGKPATNCNTGEIVDYQYEYDPDILYGSPEHIEKRMRQDGKPGESYESRVRAWCRRLEEDLETGSVINHFDLAQRIHAVDGQPWVKSQPPNEKQRQAWRVGDVRWVLPTLKDGEPCSTSILAALAGEQEGEYLADHVSGKRVCGKDEAGNELFEYLVHYSGYSGDPEWSQANDVSQILIDNFTMSEAQEAAKRRLSDFGWMSSPGSAGASTPSREAASAPSATAVPVAGAKLTDEEWANNVFQHITAPITTGSDTDAEDGEVDMEEADEHLLPLDLGGGKPTGCMSARRCTEHGTDDMQEALHMLEPLSTIERATDDMQEALCMLEPLSTTGDLEPASEEQRRAAVEEAVMQRVAAARSVNTANGVSRKGSGGDYPANRAEMLRRAMASKTGTVSKPEPKISVSFKNGRLVLRTKDDSGTESTPAMTVNLENPNRIAVVRLSGMDDTEARAFRAAAATFCGGVNRTLDPDSTMVQIQAQHLRELNQKQKERTGKPHYEFSKDLTSDRQLALAVTACRWTINAMSDLDRRSKRVMPKEGGNIKHPAQLTILCDDSGAGHRDFVDLYYAQYMNWQIDESQTESIVQADASYFQTTGVLRGDCHLPLVRMDGEIVQAKMKEGASVANLGGTNKGRGHCLMSTDAWVSPGETGWLIVHAWRTDVTVPVLLSFGVDKNKNVFPLHRGRGGASIFPAPYAEITTESTPTADNIAWFVQELAERVPGLSELVHAETEQEQGQRKAQVAGRIARAFHLGVESESEKQSDTDDDWDDDCLLPDTEINRPARRAQPGAAERGTVPRALRMARRTGEQPAAPGMHA